MIRTTRALLVALTTLLALNHPALAADTASLRTVAEQSDFQKTGRYDEVIRLCAAFQKAYPKQVRCEQFGTTPEHRPMLALIATETGAFTPEQASRRQLPVLLLQGGIHAGEIDGKDAGFLALRELLDHKIEAGALTRQVLIFVPVFNVDGHERFGRWNRPNQIGPEEMGWRTTAQNLNLNRDYVKADAPEMQAMLGLVNRWDPLVYVDMHVTDGAKFQHDISIQVEPLVSGDPALQSAGRLLRDHVVDDLNAHGAKALNFYPSFVDEDDPASGFADSVFPPRFSNGYFVLRNRFGMLVETHSWKNYATRVRLTHDTIVAVVNQIDQSGKAWLDAAHRADRIDLAGQQVPLTYKTTDESRIVQFQGYAYTREPSDVSGTLMTRYDDTTPQVWAVPLRDHVVVNLAVQAPQAGYVVPPAFADLVGTKLAQHGIHFDRLSNSQPHASVETFRASAVQYVPGSFEGRQAVHVQGSWSPETRDLPAGSLFVSIHQPKARLIMNILEPQAPDSLVAWGEFNNAFERKEYMERYVAEDVARAQMRADPALAEAFRSKLASDPAFAANPDARLNFFAQRHASWDDRYNLYPVMRSSQSPAQP